MQQLPSSLSGSSPPACRSAATQILLPNTLATASDYGPLHLTDKELDVMLGTPPASHLALVRDDQGSVVIDTDLSPLGQYLAVLGGLKAGEAVVGADYRTQPDFWRKAQ